MKKSLLRLIAGISAAGIIAFSPPSYSAQEAQTPWYFDLLGVQASRDAGLTGKGVTVALIDSGINKDHEDLISVDITGYNFLGKEPYADVTAFDDDAGHGTLAGGVLVAAAGNGLTIKSTVFIYKNMLYIYATRTERLLHQLLTESMQCKKVQKTALQLHPSKIYTLIS